MRPFDPVSAGHTVIKAAEAVGWELNTSPEQFLKHVTSIEYGLSAEVEFASILAWLGNCRLVHRLDQEYATSDPAYKPEIPDLFAVFNDGRLEASALIEVKTTKGNRLKLKRTYLDGLRDYANQLGKPLLIAWRPRSLGLWLLFEPSHLNETGDRLEIHAFDAMKNGLMDYLAGDFSLTLMPGIELRMELSLTSPGKPTRARVEHKAVVSAFEITRADGTSCFPIPKTLFTVLLMTAEQQPDEILDGVLVRRATSVPGRGVYAQHVLRAFVGAQIEDDQRVHWRHVAKDLDRILSRKQLLEDAASTIGKIACAICHTVPHVRPTFLPPGWASVPEHVFTCDGTSQDAAGRDA